LSSNRQNDQLVLALVLDDEELVLDDE